MKGKKSSNEECTSSYDSTKVTKSCSFNEDDRKRLIHIYNTVSALTGQVAELQKDLKKSNNEIQKLKQEKERLKQALNLNAFEVDNLQQYSRRENIRVHDVPESIGKGDDGESVILDLAKALEINLKKSDIQRAHRLGRKKSPAAKPRPIIARFVSYKQRNEFLFSKSKLKNCENSTFENAFITEDLTPLRSKLLHYVKNYCEDEFVLCHTYNGRIRMKKSARKYGELDDDEKDEGIGNWLMVSSPDDLFRHNIDVDFAKLDYKPLMLNIEHDDEI